MEAVPQPTTETTADGQKGCNFWGNSVLTQGTQVPETVVDSRKRTTVLGMADFGEKHGRGHLRQRVTETKNKSAAHIHWSNLLIHLQE